MDHCTFVFYDGSFAGPTAAFRDGCYHTREQVRKTTRLCQAAPNMPASFLVSYFQQRMDLTVWDSSSGESAGFVGASPGQNFPAPSELSSKNAHTDVSEPMDVDENGV